MSIKTFFLENASFDYQNANARYALLPVYIFSAKYNGKVYSFAMNGQTGKFAGDLPMDHKKVASLIAIIFVVCFMVIGLVTYFMVK